MLEYIFAATVMGAATSTIATYYLNKRKSTDIFTIKSDGKQHTEVPKNVSKDDFPTSLKKLKPENIPPPQSITRGTIKAIDMTKVTGIALEGSSDININYDRIIIDGNATFNVLGSTLWIKSTSVITIIGNYADKYYSDGKNKKSVIQEIPFINFKDKSLDRVSVQGSGTIELSNVTVASNFDALVNGSGDIILNDIGSVKLTLQVKGSGDIVVNGNTTAEHYDALVKGSGDIKLRSTNPIVTLNKIIQGSGDIKVQSHYTQTSHQNNPEMFI